jgi:hypothetical protein
MRVFPLDEQHRIVVYHEIKAGLDVETIKVERCWEKIAGSGEEIKWVEDHANYVPLIQAAWWGSKWHYEKENQIHAVTK